MKQTYNVNIGGRAYNIDTDAYEILDRYLRDISSRLKDSEGESMDDIEARIADLFDERISSTMQVVNQEMVRRAMAVIGRPEVFGGQKRGFSYHGGACDEAPRKLYRSSEDKVFGGVCGGLADYFNTDPSIIRLIAVLLLFLGGVSFWVYIVMWIVVPRAPKYLK